MRGTVVERGLEETILVSTSVLLRQVHKQHDEEQKSLFEALNSTYNLISNLTTMNRSEEKFRKSSCLEDVFGEKVDPVLEYLEEFEKIVKVMERTSKVEKLIAWE